MPEKEIYLGDVVYFIYLCECREALLVVDCLKMM